MSSGPQTSDDDSHDVGCTVTVTNDDSGMDYPHDDLFGLRNQFQMSEAGDFHYEASDPGCIVKPETGAGKIGRTGLPLAWPETDTYGDTNAFLSRGAVSVTVERWASNSPCSLSLNSVSGGRPLDSETVPKGGKPVILESGKSELVYIVNPTCQIQVTPAN